MRNRPEEIGRTIGELSVPGIDRVSVAMVEAGMGDTMLADAERKARSGKRGLWVDAAPDAPWDWRKIKSAP